VVGACASSQEIPLNIETTIASLSDRRCEPT
jgi:hypothetical protein